MMSILFVSFLQSCSPPPKDPALVEFEKFMYALKSDQKELLWQTLSSHTQKKITQKISQPLALENANSKELITENTNKDHTNKDRIFDRLRIRLGYAFEMSFAQKAKIQKSDQISDKLKFVLVPQNEDKQLKIPMLYENQSWKVDLSEAQLEDVSNLTIETKTP
jgi:hypothetical protein